MLDTFQDKLDEHAAGAYQVHDSPPQFMWPKSVPIHTLPLAAAMLDPCISAIAGVA
jgi:hypothetical protein